jgi:pectin methylesterase-like acyl-CoA thioesterase
MWNNNSLQGAIDAASPGDVITVPAGTYTEYILIQKDNLTIQGAGIDQTIIDLDGLAPYVHYGTSAGYCVAGVLVTGHGSPDGENTDRVTGVTIKDLTVKNAD